MGQEDCSIVGVAGLLVQLSLAFLSFSVLIIKRQCEEPPRPWKIWALDTSKQVISQILAHFINLIISLALTYEDNTNDNCLWYFITNVLDNTIGVLICVLILRWLEKRFIKNNKTYLVSGYYYSLIDPREQVQNNHEEEPPNENTQLTQPIIKIDKCSWGLQLLVWNSVVILTKIIVFMLEFFFRKVLDTISTFLLGWIENYPNLELVFVLVLGPVVMNGFAFWVQDNFLKKRNIDEEIKEIQQEIQEQKRNEPPPEQGPPEKPPSIQE